MQFVTKKSAKSMIKMGMNVRFDMFTRDSWYLTRSAIVMLSAPIVRPIVPAIVNRKLGFRNPFIKLGGVNFAVKVVIATSIISMPMNVTMKPIECMIRLPRFT